MTFTRRATSDINLPPVIPYLNDEHADAATKNSRLKLLFRLAKFLVLEEREFCGLALALCI